MSAYSKAIDEACDKRALALSRDLNSDEIEEVEDRLFKSWIGAGRFTELIEYAKDEFELQDGEAFCTLLGNAICKAKNTALAQQLFEGLARAREAAFWRVWPKAQLGQIGAMKEPSTHLANAMKALAELYRCYAALENEAGKHRVQAEMLRLQERRKSQA
jgi:hypothetical protein